MAVWDADPALHAAAEAERRRHRAVQLEVADARPPEYSDEALALRFSEKYATDAAFTAQWGQWFWWTGSRWSPDETLLTYDRACAICRVASAEITDAKATKMTTAVASARTVAAVEKLACSDRRHAVTSDQWNADTLLFHIEEPDADG